MDNYIFLDIDGVLNNEKYMLSLINKDISCGICNLNYLFNPLALDNLSRIIRKTNAKIILSSTWRGSYFVDKDSSEKQVIDFYFNLFKIPLPIDRTGFHQSKRGDEIQDYLNKHPEIVNFIIIDDDNDMLHLSDKLIQCTNGQGLTKKVANKAITYLTK